MAPDLPDSHPTTCAQPCCTTHPWSPPRFPHPPAGSQSARRRRAPAPPAPPETATRPQSGGSGTSAGRGGTGAVRDGTRQCRAREAGGWLVLCCLNSAGCPPQSVFRRRPTPCSTQHTLRAHLLERAQRVQWRQVTAVGVDALHNDEAPVQRLPAGEAARRGCRGVSWQRQRGAGKTGKGGGLAPRAKGCHQTTLAPTLNPSQPRAHLCLRSRSACCLSSRSRSAGSLCLK